MAKYDEDLAANPLYQYLKTDYPELLAKCVEEQWLIAIPRRMALGSLATPTQRDVTAHILVPNPEMPDTHFTSLNDVELRRTGSQLAMLEAGHGLGSVRILFSESFYDEQLAKYRLLCLSGPLRPPSSGEDTPEGAGVVADPELDGVAACVDFLVLEVGGERILGDLEALVAEFQRTLTPRPLEADFFDLCERAERHVRHHFLRSTVPSHRLGLALETYFFHHLNTYLLDQAIASHYEAQECLNLALRGLIHLTPEELGHTNADFRPNWTQVSLGLAKLPFRSTPQDKLRLLQKAVDDLTQSEGGDWPEVVITTDDLLPAVVYSVIGSEVPNWLGEMEVMKLKSLADFGHAEARLAFSLTTFEAALAHIRSLDPWPFLRENVLALADRAPFQEALPWLMSEDLPALSRWLAHEPKTVVPSNPHHPLCDCLDCRPSLDGLEGLPLINRVGPRGLSLLHVACMLRKSLAVELLLSVPAVVVDLVDASGMTPLHHAAQLGHQNALLLLLQAGASVNRRCLTGHTALHWACHQGHDSCVKALVYFCEHRSIPLDINVQNASGQTPLHLSARWGFSKIVQLLVEYHADRSLRTHDHETAFELAQNAVIKDILRTEGQDPDLNYFQSQTPAMQANVDRHLRLFKAIKAGDPALVRNLLEPQVQRTLFDSEGLGLIHVAVQCQSIAVLQVLLNAGVPVLVHAHSSGMTPLHLACLNNDQATLELLVAHVSPKGLNAQDKLGNSCLHYSVESGDLEIAALLLAQGASIHVKNFSGLTPYDLAQHLCNIKVTNLIETYK